MLASCWCLLALLVAQTAIAQAPSSQDLDLWEILKSSSRCSKGYVKNLDDYTNCSELTMVKDATFIWIPGSDETILLAGDRLPLWNGSSATGPPDSSNDINKRAQNLCGNSGPQGRDIGDCIVRQEIKYPMSAHNCANASGKFYACITFTWSPNSPKNPPVKVPHYHCERVQNWIGWEKGECFA